MIRHTKTLLLLLLGIGCSAPALDSGAADGALKPAPDAGISACAWVPPKTTWMLAPLAVFTDCGPECDNPGFWGGWGLTLGGTDAEHSEAWPRWQKTREQLQGVSFFFGGPRTLFPENLQSIRSAKLQTSFVGSMGTLASHCQDTAHQLLEADLSQWVDANREPLHLPDGSGYSPDSLEVDELMNSRVMCGRDEPAERDLYSAYLTEYRTRFPASKVTLDFLVPAPEPTRDMAGETIKLLEQLCNPSAANVSLCPNGINVETYLFSTRAHAQEQLRRLRDYVKGAGNHWGRPIDFNVFIVDQCGFDPRGAALKAPLELSAHDEFVHHCDASKGSSLAAWQNNLILIHNYNAQLLGSAAYADHLIVADWQGTFLDQMQGDFTNPGVLAPPGSSQVTFLSGVESVAKASQAGALNRYLTPAPAATTFSPGPSVTYDGTLGHLQPGPWPGQIPLYNCGATGLHTVPCKGGVIEGYFYPSSLRAAGSKPLYRCRNAAGERFASLDFRCEGGHLDAQLGNICP